VRFLDLQIKIIFSHQSQKWLRIFSNWKKKKKSEKKFQSKFFKESQSSWFIWVCFWRIFLRYIFKTNHKKLKILTASSVVRCFIQIPNFCYFVRKLYKKNSSIFVMKIFFKNSSESEDEKFIFQMHRGIDMKRKSCWLLLNKKLQQIKNSNFLWSKKIFSKTVHIHIGFLSLLKKYFITKYILTASSLWIKQVPKKVCPNPWI